VCEVTVVTWLDSDAMDVADTRVKSSSSLELGFTGGRGGRREPPLACPLRPRRYEDALDLCLLEVDDEALQVSASSIPTKIGHAFFLIASSHSQ
jgi:hypothetical protein